VEAGRPKDAGRGRNRRGRFLTLAVAVFAAAAAFATWPAIRHLDGDHYLARPSPGFGEAAAGDHLQLGYALWLVGHQLENGKAPWEDPYSFRPEADAPPSLQGWLYALPFWPVDAAAGPVWAYNAVVLLSVLLAGLLTTAWLRGLGVSRPAAVLGGLVFALAPYRVGQSTGHLLGLAAVLLPAVLHAVERRRYVLAAAALAAVPLSGQVHLALGAIPLALAYAWARTPRRDWWKAIVVAAVAAGAGVLVREIVIRDSVASGGRSFNQVRRYSAELTDLFGRRVGDGVEELVFLGWLTPLLAIAGLFAAWRLGRGLATVLVLGTAVPVVLALGSNTPLYRWLWDGLPFLRFARVPERLMPVACLALAGLVALAVNLVLNRHKPRLSRPALAGALTLVIGVAIAADLRVPVFGAIAADTPNAAYAAMRERGALLELPVIRPDIHYGSVYVGYVRQSPRVRPQGYSTVAPAAADRLARDIRGLSCGRGELPARLGVRYVAVHHGVYRQTGFFASGCAARAEEWLRARGWRVLARDGQVSSWETPRR
jgi:hypothetical protein